MSFCVFFSLRSMWWVDPSWQLSPHPVSFLVPHSTMEDRIRKAKAKLRKINLSRWRQFKKCREKKNKKGKKRTTTSDAKAINHSRPPTSRPMRSQSLSNNLLGKTPPHSVIAEHDASFIVEQDVLGYGVSFCQFRSALLALSPSSLLPTRSLLTGGAEWEQRKPWGRAGTVQLRVVCYQFCLVTDLKHSTTWAEMTKTDPTRLGRKGNAFWAWGLR